jgi:hypothetical protein
MLPLPPLPDHWSDEQVFAVYEFLDACLGQIWQRYQAQIQHQYRVDRAVNAPPERFDNDNELPF